MPGTLRYDALWTALQCPCGACAGVPEDARIEAALRETLAWLEHVSRAFGGVPILVLAGGGYRCRDYQEEISEPGGEEHLTGRAVDLVLRDFSPRQVQTHLRSWWGPGKLVRGLGSARGYSHIDRREGEPALWRISE